MPPVVLIAPAAFKGTLGPRQVAAAISLGVRRAFPEASVIECPIADGGNGLLDVVLPPTGALRERVEVTGPIGEKVSAEIGWIDAETAIIESASACGLALVEPEDRDPLSTTTRGVGELIWIAADRGARTIVVGLGGSATVDGGTGAARGFGWTFENAAGEQLPDGGGALADVATFGPGWGLSASRVIALADVATPLIGPQGAAPVFGPQKGARAEEIPQLVAGLERLAQLWAQAGRPELGTMPMGGAAGGLAAGLVFFAKAELAAGADWVLERAGFDAALAKADLVITAEGSFDRTSLVGKAPGEVVRRALAAKKKVAVVAGKVESIPGIHAIGADGGRRMLDGPALARMAERVARQALHI
ncbi:MAG TPA: glycerate kinase [Gemmatimonadales bacterium]|nr:glycerate kinase [Gemmatimonadales bacterium]